MVYVCVEASLQESNALQTGLVGSRVMCHAHSSPDPFTKIRGQVQAARLQQGESKVISLLSIKFVFSVLCSHVYMWS